MMMQKPKKINLEFSDQKITAHSGLLLVADAIQKYGLDKEFDKLPLPKSNRGQRAAVYLMAILMNFAGGGKTMADVSRVLEDNALVGLLKLKKFEISALVKWINRNSQMFITQVQSIHQKLMAKIIKESGITELTFDIDAMLIEAEKKSAAKTYKGFKGYNALLAFIPELGLNIFESLRIGSTSPASGLLDALNHARNILPKGVDFKDFRSDSAAWIGKLMCYLEDTGIDYTITADLNSAVRKVIRQIPQGSWTPIMDEKGKPTGREYAETVYCMNKAPHAHRLIVQRSCEEQLDLFSEGKQHHYAISTNKTISAIDVIKHHNGRANAENFNKEAKYGVNLDYLPSNQLETNQLWFSLGMMTYNLFQAIKLFALPEDWRKKQIGTLRWQLVQIAGRLTFHARQITLKLCGISKEIYDIFFSARMRLCSS